MLTLLLVLSCRTKDLWDSGGLILESAVDDSTVDSPADSSVEDTGCDDPLILYTDGDGDGWGAGEPIISCDPIEGMVERDGDCNDEDAAFHPEAPEEDCADPEDYNCDGSTGYVDADGDGHAACLDCDDANPEVNSDAAEVCNGRDDDCDGLVDDEDDPVEGTTTWYADTDGDGLGDAASTVQTCEQPSDYVADATDCDDSTGDVGGPSTWYADTDGDGYGDGGSPLDACTQPSGYVADATDCDDSTADVSPDADELCNNKVDDDCDGTTDEDDAVDALTWYLDSDGDGYGDSSAGTATACTQPSGYAAADGDCDETDSGINPGASETCDGVDEDCSGAQDDGGVCPCDVEYYNNEVYLFCQTASPWSTAQSSCSSHGYHLLTIDDGGENAWADSTADTYSTSKWWMGFNDISSEGTWVWEDGSSVSYTHWQSSEPNNSGNEDCGQLNRYTNQTWNDEPCSSAFYFICEVG